MKESEAREILREYRESGIRRSDEVVEIGEPLLSSLESRGWGNEVWLIYEQLYIAALDCNRMDVVGECIGVLSRRFPGSTRVKKLDGQYLEATGDYEAAMDVYDEILEAEPADTFCRKRIVAIHLANNRIGDAIRELNEYLKQFQSDHEAWMELSALYIREYEYGKAAFCMEELILSNPHHHLYHQRYAEIKYTQGGIENTEVARKHFANAVKLNAGNMRALYGLYLASTGLAGSSKVSAKSKKDNSKYATWAAKKIAEMYAEVGSRAQPVESVTAMLESLQVNSL